jgi:hypothetical protein
LGADLDLKINYFQKACLKPSLKLYFKFIVGFDIAILIRKNIMKWTRKLQEHAEHLTHIVTEIALQNCRALHCYQWWIQKFRKGEDRSKKGGPPPEIAKKKRKKKRKKITYFGSQILGFSNI